jgi:formylglycine-generating enzyme required for sulfatase activity
VTITNGFWLSITPITRNQYRATGGCGWVAPGDRPHLFNDAGDCLAFCEQLAVKTDKRYRVTMEAEREWACRAGTTTPYYFGETLSPHQARFRGSRLSRVGSFPPNAWGLYDMHGNVAECCQVGDSNSYVRRGGSHLHSLNNCRSASRTDGSAWTGCRPILLG